MQTGKKAKRRIPWGSFRCANRLSCRFVPINIAAVNHHFRVFSTVPAGKPLKPSWPAELRSKAQQCTDANCAISDIGKISG